MKILITGTSGHLGEALVRTLRKSKHEIVGIDILPSEFTNCVGSIAKRDFVFENMKDVNVVFHAATLHKPHVVTHTKQNFVDANITGTLNLLEAAIANNVQSFIFTSTTSTFGDAMRPSESDPAVWVTEKLMPRPKNIYGVTKTAAEDLCQIFARNYELPCLILKTSRFFLELDDDPTKRGLYQDENIKANEYTHRRADIQDIVDAHLLAMEKASAIGFGKYIISSMSPFTKDHLPTLNQNAPEILKELYPDFEEIYAARKWKMFPRIPRVYVNHKARTELGWEPKYNFKYVLDCVKEGKDFKSELAKSIGIKRYHQEEFEDGPYPVKE